MLASTVFDEWIMSSLRQKSWLRSQSQGHHERMEPILYSLRRIHLHHGFSRCVAELPWAVLQQAAPRTHKPAFLQPSLPQPSGWSTTARSEDLSKLGGKMFYRDPTRSVFPLD